MLALTMAAILNELWQATIAVALLTVVIILACFVFTDLPLHSILLGELIGAPTAIAILTLASPRRRRR